MKANEKGLLRFLEGADKQFIIPIYQRNYDWKKEQCEQLFNDLIDICKNNFRNHFLGSIVSIYYDDGDGQEYLVIDGQQRLTTISLLLLAIYNLIELKKINTEFKKEQLKEEYLVNKYSHDDKKLRLKHIKDDSIAFESLFTNREEEFIQDSNITKNYKYFKNKLLSLKEITIDDLYKAIKKLIVVEIELKRGEDDPQLIFESLNSTGLSLTEADLVRNYVLMKEDTEHQNIYYTKYWRNIEVNTNYKVNEFIRDYLTFKERSIPNKDNVYKAFKKYTDKNYNCYENKSVELLLKDMMKFSQYYKQFTRCCFNDKKIDKLLTNINNLDMTVCYPFLLEVFDDFNNEIINREELIEVLYYIESFAFRRSICDVPTNALNKVFMTLGRDIKKYSDYRDNYINIFKYILINKKLSQRFPKNDEFAEKLVSRDIYNLKNKNKYHLLQSLENYENKEVVDIIHLIADNTLTIEHIMPQKLTSQWKNSLGENYEGIYDKYINTLGNITLTGYNSSYSNKSFINKKEMDKGFNESRLFLNSYLRSVNKWTEYEIRERAARLKDKSLQIWKFPELEYSSKEDMLNLYSLADENDFTGERIQSYIFKGEEYNVKSWKDFYESIATLLYDYDSIIFENLIRNHNESSNRVCFSNKKEELKRPIEISNSVYLEGRLSTEGILNMIRLLLKEYNIKEDEVSFYLKEIASKDDGDKQLVFNNIRNSEKSINKLFEY
ncbi:DUF262 domain-containing protein [Clostridium massiliodielmoense]|uniref:DUF262 domain-containing protein n=1 Tax=Clostridium massiliodielmoense TaxID=1776385 RepID=UPI000A26E1F6|nr:DUF262 domain-containing protein [Clostridium massiliodielmoense]